jgi:type IV pilus assembly protein PilY1
VVDTDGNGAADRVYGGDLQGKLWAFDLSSTNDSQWKSAYKSGSNPAPLFTANTNQPITVEPIIVNHPTVTDTTNNQPNLLVLFGTGQYLVDGDKTTTNVQSFYGVWDKGTSALTRSELVAQTLSNAPSTTNVRLITDNAVDYEASGGNAKYGWYVDLSTGLDISGDGTVDTSAERVVVRPVARRDNIFFNTMLPKTDVCDYGGAGWLMSISIENGGSPETTPFDLNGDDVIGENDMITITDNNGDETLVSAVGTLLDIGIPAQSGFLGDRQYTPHTGDESGSENSDGDEGNRFIDDRRVVDVSGQFSGRVSWEELINE